MEEISKLQRERNREYSLCSAKPSLSSELIASFADILTFHSRWSAGHQSEDRVLRSLSFLPGTTASSQSVAQHYSQWEFSDVQMRSQDSQSCSPIQPAWHSPWSPHSSSSQLGTLLPTRIACLTLHPASLLLTYPPAPLTSLSIHPAWDSPACQPHLPHSVQPVWSSPAHSTHSPSNQLGAHLHTHLIRCTLHPVCIATVQLVQAAYRVHFTLDVLLQGIHQA